MAQLEAPSLGRPGAGSWTMEAVSAPATGGLRGPGRPQPARERASAAEVAHRWTRWRRGHGDLNVTRQLTPAELLWRPTAMSPRRSSSCSPTREADLRMPHRGAGAHGHVGDPVAVPALLSRRARRRGAKRVRSFMRSEALSSIGAGRRRRLGSPTSPGPATASRRPPRSPRACEVRRSARRAGVDRRSSIPTCFWPAVVDTLAAIGDEDAVAPLVAVLNGGADVNGAAAITGALERIRARAEETFSAGGHIVDLTRAALRPSGVAALTAARWTRSVRRWRRAFIAVLGLERHGRCAGDCPRGWQSGRRSGGGRRGRGARSAASRSSSLISNVVRKATAPRGYPRRLSSGGPDDLRACACRWSRRSMAPT